MLVLKKLWAPYQKQKHNNNNKNHSNHDMIMRQASRSIYCTKNKQEMCSNRGRFKL